MAGSQTITAVVAADAKPFQRGMQSASRSTKTLTSSLKNVGVIAGAAFAAAGAALLEFGVEAIKAADQSRQISRSLEVAVRNSKAFGSTSAEIGKVTGALDEASRAMGELTGIDDEVISGIKRNWLSVPNITRIGVARINKLAMTAADVAAGTGKSFEDIASAFTKAFADPKGALKKLQKAGVVLNKQDKQRYDLLVAQGKEQEALAFLQDTLATKYKGQAEAIASPFQRLQVSWGNFQESVGETFLPIIDEQLPKIQKGLRDLALDPDFQAAVKAIGDIFESLGTKIGEAGAALGKWKVPDAIAGYIDWFINNMPNILMIIDVLGQLTGATADRGNSYLAGVIPLTKKTWENWSKNIIDSVKKQTTQPNPAAGPLGGATYNININASSVDTSANTGKAIANALTNYLRTSGKNTVGPLKSGYVF